MIISAAKPRAFLFFIANYITIRIYVMLIRDLSTFFKS